MPSKKKIGIVVGIVIAILGLSLINLSSLNERMKPKEHIDYATMPLNARSTFIDLYKNKPELFVSEYKGNIQDIVPNAIIDAQVRLYRLDTRYNAKQDVIAYLQDVEGEFPFESHRRNMFNYDWEYISKDMRQATDGVITVYSFRYSNLTPSCNDYELHISSEGYIMDYRYDMPKMDMLKK